MSEYTPRRPDRTLHGKVAIVTGAGAAGDGIGNGRASSILFAEDGCAIVCVDRDLALAKRTVEMIEDMQRRKARQADANPNVKSDNQLDDHNQTQAVAVEADVSLEEDCKRVVKTAVDTYGRIDILFNCVGIGGAPGTAIDVDMDLFRKGFEVNVFSMVQMAKYAIPEMIKNDPSQGWKGSIVNMASVAGIRGGTPHLLYPTTKGTVVQMTRAMAAHHAADLIRVNCVCPGMVFTPMMYAGGMTDATREARKNRSLLKTEGNAWDVASSVRFLAGDEARWITGQKLVVDAGVSCAVGTDIPKAASVNG